MVHLGRLGGSNAGIGGVLDLGVEVDLPLLDLTNSPAICGLPSINEGPGVGSPTRLGNGTLGMSFLWVYAVDILEYHGILVAD